MDYTKIHNFECGPAIHGYAHEDTSSICICVHLLFASFGCRRLACFLSTSSRRVAELPDGTGDDKERQWKVKERIEII
jgi:hypothetical protein